MLLWGWGWLSWVKPQQRLKLAVVLGGIWLLLAGLLPWLTIRPAYAWPEPITAVPPTAEFGPIRFLAEAGEIELVGVEMTAGQRVTAGENPVELTLYWRATAVVELYPRTGQEYKVQQVVNWDVRGYQAQVVVAKNKLAPAGKRASVSITFNGTVAGRP